MKILYLFLITIATSIVNAAEYALIERDIRDKDNSPIFLVRENEPSKGMLGQRARVAVAIFNPSTTEVSLLNGEVLLNLIDIEDVSLKSQINWNFAQAFPDGRLVIPLNDEKLVARIQRVLGAKGSPASKNKRTVISIGQNTLTFGVAENGEFCAASGDYSENPQYYAMDGWVADLELARFLFNEVVPHYKELIESAKIAQTKRHDANSEKNIQRLAGERENEKQLMIAEQEKVKRKEVAKRQKELSDLLKKWDKIFSNDELRVLSENIALAKVDTELALDGAIQAKIDQVNKAPGFLKSVEDIKNAEQRANTQLKAERVNIDAAHREVEVAAQAAPASDTGAAIRKMAFLEASFRPSAKLVELNLKVNEAKESFFIKYNIDYDQMMLFLSQNKG